MSRSSRSWNWWIVLSAVVAWSSAGDAEASEVTFTRDVAPILFKHCATCHRPGEVGPFSLLNYQDVAKRAEFIKDVTQAKRMPPWKAESGFGHFLDERRLTDQEIATIATWADTGAKEGDPNALPAAPKFPEGWQLGQPDRVLKMVKPFQVPAGGSDVYQCFVIPIPIEKDEMVTAIEFRPGNARVVHHAILYLESRGQARALDPKGDGYRSFGGPGLLPSGGLGAWVPGSMPRHLPEGLGRYLKKGSDLVLQIHYHPSGKAEEDQSSVGIYFAKQPVKQMVAGMAVRSRGLHIPPAESRFHVTASSQPLPVDANLIAIGPHMHMIGREMKVIAETPGGQTIPLIWIKDWDFNWQGSYYYADPIRLPKGSVVKLDAYYDNSENNPQNPSSPPKLVRWGEQTTDEMCLLGLQLTADSLGDLRKITSMRGGLLGTALFGGIPIDEANPPKYDNVKLPAEGVPIPDRFRAVLGLYDRDRNNRLTQEEVERMPERLRNRVLEFVGALLPDE